MHVCMYTFLHGLGVGLVGPGVEVPFRKTELVLVST